MNLIHITSPQGFWSNLLAILYHILVSIENEEDYYVLWQNQLYMNSPDDNIFNYFFIQKHDLPDFPSKIITHHGFRYKSYKGDQIGHVIDLAKTKGKTFRQLMSDTFNTLTLRPEIVEKTQIMFPKDTIGIHIRSTDRIANSTEKVYSSPIADVYAKHVSKSDNIFIATDNYNNLKIFEAYPYVYTYDAIRSNNTTGVHFLKNKDNRKKAEDVFIESMLLSKCGSFICGTSNIATGVLIINPNLKYTDLSKVYKKDLEKLHKCKMCINEYIDL
jgi:hypothetical protein